MLGLILRCVAVLGVLQLVPTEGHLYRLPPARWELQQGRAEPSPVHLELPPAPSLDELEQRLSLSLDELEQRLGLSLDELEQHLGLSLDELEQRLGLSLGSDERPKKALTLLRRLPLSMFQRGGPVPDGERGTPTVRKLRFGRR
ncbi:uncharacterized protein LOC119102840 [Pollicipes pollicipes]|uniref:uncharacterized protein LOC119102840 n=1 Tax=Pollicipes pollicipes TaxID=41117 RepID=UPI0018859229|nr:uncharacterized protein LOC119102840 [Pollicipes pollicipes]